MNKINKEIVQKFRNSSVWDREFKDLDDVFENGILKCDMIPNFSKAINSIVNTGDVIKSVSEKYLSRFDLSVAQKNVLDALYFSKKDYMTQHELSKFMYTSKANVSSILERMKNKELIGREENPDNKREKKVMLTKKGESLIMEIFASSGGETLINMISDEDAKALIDILKKVRLGFRELENADD